MRLPRPRFSWKHLLSLVSLAAFIYLATLVPYMFEVYDLVKENPGDKLTGTQQFAGALVVGVNAGMLVAGLFLFGFGVFIAWMTFDTEDGTGSTGAR